MRRGPDGDVGVLAASMTLTDSICMTSEATAEVRCTSALAISAVCSESWPVTESVMTRVVVELVTLRS